MSIGSSKNILRFDYLKNQLDLVDQNEESLF